jgi:hypothetical protein
VKRAVHGPLGLIYTNAAQSTPDVTTVGTTVFIGPPVSTLSIGLAFVRLIDGHIVLEAADAIGQYLL